MTSTTLHLYWKSIKESLGRSAVLSWLSSSGLIIIELFELSRRIGPHMVEKF